MEEWGSGFRRINQECENAKINLPKFQENELDCSIVFERVFERKNENKVSDVEKSSVEKFDETEKSSVKKFGENTKSSVKIIEMMKENNSITAEELSDILKISKRAVEKQIKKLRESGKIKRVGSDKNGTWKVINGE